MIGLYPLTGQTTFLILSPWFRSLTLTLGSGNTLTVTTTTVDGTPESDRSTARYVQSLKINGQTWDKAWLAWEDVFENGGTIEYMLGPNATNWATGDLPPSPASG